VCCGEGSQDARSEGARRTRIGAISMSRPASQSAIAGPATLPCSSAGATFRFDPRCRDARDSIEHPKPHEPDAAVVVGGTRVLAAPLSPRAANSR
jgi:hypothetical protein